MKNKNCLRALKKTTITTSKGTTVETENVILDNIQSTVLSKNKPSAIFKIIEFY